MEKHKAILTNLNYVAVSICVFFSAFLIYLGKTSHISLFIAGIFVFAINGFAIYKSRFTIAYVIFGLMANFLMVTFDAGLSGKTASFVYYFPLLLSNYVLTEPNEKRSRILLFVVTLLCIYLINFTPLTPKYALLLEDASSIYIFTVFNIGVSILASIFILQTIVKAYLSSEKRLKDEREKLIESEQRALAAKLEAEKASKEKSNFLSTISHEIRTPIHAVIGISNLLIEQKTMPEQAKNLSVLKYSAENLLNLINNVLDLNKIEAGKLELNPSPTNLFELLNRICSLFEFQSSEKSIAFIKDFSLTHHTYELDSLRLSQVLTNLLSNAIRFTEHGSIAIRVKELSENEKESTLLFEISDTGRGIESKDLSKIFDRYKQVGPPASSLYEGSGLGLAITKSIINLMHSDVSVESSVGKGSRFFFTLILNKKEENVLLHYNQNAAGVSQKALHILLAEDNDLNILVITQFLTRFGYQVEVVKDGKEAVEACSTGNFDIVLMDLHMPLMNGYEAAQAIRNRSIHTPIIALTADAFAETLNKALSNGIDDYVLKPFNPEELLDKINKHVPISLKS
jgi:signal transduction histidine kinase/CheY-like chemotaxis protein